MDINRLTRDADDLIRKIVSRYNQLYNPAGNITQVELDLMLDDLRKLYDTFKTIGHLNLAHSNELKKPDVTVIAQSPAQVQPQSEVPPQQSAAPLEKHKTESTIHEKQSEPESVIPPVPAEVPAITPDEGKESMQDTNINPGIENASVYETPPTARTEVPVSEQPMKSTTENGSKEVNHQAAQSMLADKFNPVTKSLSETIAATPPQSVVGARLQFQPITDLATAIGLNDKFSFISELFGNNQVQYEEAIARINNAVNLDEANWILQKYNTREWSQKEETLNRMKDFVKRRFI